MLSSDSCSRLDKIIANQHVRTTSSDKKINSPEFLRIYSANPNPNYRNDPITGEAMVKNQKKSENFETQGEAQDDDISLQLINFEKNKHKISELTPGIKAKLIEKYFEKFKNDGFEIVLNENEKKEKLDTDKDSGSDSKKSKNKFLNEIYKQKNKILSLFSIFSIIFLNLLLSYRKSDEEKHSKENKLIQNSKSFSEIIEKKFEEIKEENKDIIRFNKSLNQLEFQGLSIQLKNQIRDFFKKNIDSQFFKLTESGNKFFLKLSDIHSLEQGNRLNALIKIYGVLEEFKSKYGAKIKDDKITIEAKASENRAKAESQLQAEKELNDLKNVVNEILSSLFQVTGDYNSINLIPARTLEDANIKLKRLDKLIQMGSKDHGNFLSEKTANKINEISKYFGYTRQSVKAEEIDKKLLKTEVVEKNFSSSEARQSEENTQAEFKPSSEIRPADIMPREVIRSREEDLKKADLEQLRLILQGVLHVNNRFVEAEKFAEKTLKSYPKGYATQIIKNDLNLFDPLINSTENIASFNQFRPDYRKISEEIYKADLAKNYFHNELDQIVLNILSKERKDQSPPILSDEIKKINIKNGIYFFLNYMMGDELGMLKAYDDMANGKLVAGISGLGHASGADYDRVKRLCCCLEHLKLGKDMNSEQLEDFFKNGDAFFVKSKPSAKVSVVNITSEIELDDKSFLVQIVRELAKEDKDKIKGIDVAKNKVLEFIQNYCEKNINIDKIESERYCEIYLASEDEALKLLNQKPDLIEEMTNQNDEFKKLREDLSKIYHQENQKLIEREGMKMTMSAKNRSR